MRRHLLPACLALLMCAFAIAPVDASGATTRRCGNGDGYKNLRARGATCAVAKSVARTVTATRRSVDLFARADRCGEFCVVARGFRCRPERSAKPRERCTRGKRRITWLQA